MHMKCLSNVRKVLTERLLRKNRAFYQNTAFAIAATVSEVFEKWLLSRMCFSLDGSAYQFGLKNFHSMDFFTVASNVMFGYHRKLNTF